MDHKVGMGFLAGAALGLAVGRLWPRPPAEPSPEPRLSASAPRVRPVRSRPTAVEPPPGPVDALPEAPVPTGHGAALHAVARLTGDAVLRCDAAGLLPDGPVVGLARARVEGGVLLALAEEASGDAQIRLPEDLPSEAPLAVVRWWAAWGEDARCFVQPAVEVVVAGVLVDPAGRPVTDAEVGNAVDGGIPVGPDGRFGVRCWKDASCPVGARRLGEPGWGRFEVLVPSADLASVTLVLEDPGPTQDLRGWLEARVAEEERLGEQPDPLRLALADPALDEEGRAAIRAWIDEQEDDRATDRALLALLAR